MGGVVGAYAGALSFAIRSLRKDGSTHETAIVRRSTTLHPHHNGQDRSVTFEDGLNRSEMYGRDGVRQESDAAHTMIIIVKET